MLAQLFTISLGLHQPCSPSSPLFPHHRPWAPGTGQLDKSPSDLAWAALPAPWKGPVSPQDCTVSCGIQLLLSQPPPLDGHTQALQVEFTFKVGQKNNSQTGNVCHKCLDSRNEPVRKGNTTRSPACTAPGDRVHSLPTDHRAEMERHS